LVKNSDGTWNDPLGSPSE